MVRLLLRIATYPRRLIKRHREQLARLRSNKTFRIEDHRNVRITYREGNGPWIMLRDFDKKD